MSRQIQKRSHRSQDKLSAGLKQCCIVRFELTSACPPMTWNDCYLRYGAMLSLVIPVRRNLAQKLQVGA